MSERRYHGTEIARKRVLANFRIEPWNANPHVARYKRRPGMSPTHLSLIRLLPCCITERGPCREVHHLKSMIESQHGFVPRSEDRWALPLSREPHDLVERIGSRGERAWFLKQGIDPHALAKALWNVTGNIDHMRRVLMAHFDRKHQ